ncbi:hypothetical protein C6497_10425 [Candidatus Poribacteria bacterium]|nr:MAG: hypothetical protein C6497_10425 [Candidatus Poribacteria bacterium]
MRGKNRLQTKGESLVIETVGSLQLSTDLTEGIMKDISDIKPTSSVVKPFLPWGWAALSTAVLLVMLLLGTMNQYITDFQQPYNFQALSEPTIEIVEAPISVDLVPKTIVRKRLTRNVSLNNNNGTGTQVSNTEFTSNVSDNSLRLSDSKWTQLYKPSGVDLYNILAAEDNLYAASSTGVYRLSEDATTWAKISTVVPIEDYKAPIIEYQGVFYSIHRSRILFSTDKGRTWDVLCLIPFGEVIGFIISERTRKSKTEESFVMYLALLNKGIYQSVDAGVQWTPINQGLEFEYITPMTKVKDTIFIGTNQGLYRWNSTLWERLPIEQNRLVYSLAVFRDNLYIATGPNSFSLDKSRKIFYSSDLGTSWIEISPPGITTHRNVSSDKPTNITVYGNTILVFLGGLAYRSNDHGKTWENMEFNKNRMTAISSTLMTAISSVLAVNENIFYNVGSSKIKRSINNGTSWHTCVNNILGTKILKLITFNNKLYVSTGNQIHVSTDNGYTWEYIHFYFDSGKSKRKRSEYVQQHTNFVDGLKWKIVNSTLYVIIPYKDKLYIYRSQVDKNDLSLVQEISCPEVPTSDNIIGDFTVSDNVFYIEYNRQLYKWELGNTELKNIELIDTTKYSDGTLNSRIKVSASRETVYAGRQDGRLFQSIDNGISWRDITSNFPLSFSNLTDIVFVNNTVYVATEKGVLASEDGEYWYRPTDNEGKHIILDKLITHSSRLYGTNNIGVYHLDDRGKWEQFLPNIPDKVIDLTYSDTKLYIATDQQGIFYSPL